MSGPNHPSNWERLFRIACSLIRQVNSEQRIIESWSFGGGTAMMLQIGHRESHDVDIFITDPQWLAFLNPQTHDFAFEIMPADYNGDGSGFLKLAFENIGKVDFIVGRPMTATPTSRTILDGEDIDLETIPEIITKKIYHRGSNIKPRDIFDIAASSLVYDAAIIDALRAYPDSVAMTLSRMEKLKPDFVNAAIAQLSIRDSYLPIAATAIERTKELLLAV